MREFIKLIGGSISIDASDLKKLSRGSTSIAHLSEENKDIVMAKKDELFGKTKQQPKDIEPAINNNDTDKES